MLILSKAKITVRGGDVRVEGGWSRYAARIRALLDDLGVREGVVRYRFSAFRFSRHIPATLRQRIRNFLVNECPLRG